MTELFITEGVEQPELRTLIGAGFAPPERMNELAFTPESGLPMSITKEGTGGGPPATLRALDQLGIKLEEIKVVVIQHMHWDFEYFCDYVPNAQIIIQKREILSAIDPTPECRFGCPKEGTNLVLKRTQPNHLLIIDGDYEVWPGYYIIATPGHTDGHQEVVLQTEKGRAIVGSENTFPSNTFPDDPRWTIPGIDPAPYTFAKGGYIAPQHCCGDPMEWVASIDKAKSFMTGANDIIVPCLLSGIHAIPYQWWTFPPEEEVKKLAALQATDDYWTAGQGIFPDCYEFLKIREARLKSKSK
jgi:glyoxylase-like metal-dependent hydrolase (beta-lactamase superfamily II)